MFWVVFVLIIILCLVSLISFKYGELKELHKVRAEFEHYLDAHRIIEDPTIDGIKLAENIVDRMIEEEKL